jgi:membrane associated rhomboid family serine protease
MINDSYHQPQNPLEELKKFFRTGSALSILILINVTIWVIIQFVRVIYFFINEPGEEDLNTILLHVFAIPAYIPDLLTKPWTVLTYNFLHFDIWHILFNMIWLYWFGKIFLEFLTSRQLVLVYLLGGISGGLIYVFAFNVFPVFAQILPVAFALGASASVMAIVTAISFYVPGYTIQLFLLGRLRIGYLALILFVFDFFMIPSGNAGGHIAHIGGALFGVLYIFLSKPSRRNLSAFTNFSFLNKVNGWFKKKKHEPRFSSEFNPRPMSDDEYNKRKKQNQQRIDEILEKISRGGYDSLTREEKEILFNNSNKS